MSLLVLLTCAAHQGHYPPRGPGSREKEVGTSTRLRMGASIAHPVNLQRPSSSTHRPPVPGWVVRSAPSATGLLLKLGAPLGPRACAHHLRPLPLIHTKDLRPELLKFLKHLPIVASRASYLLAAPRTPPPPMLWNPQTPRIDLAPSHRPVPRALRATKRHTLGVCTSGPSGTSNFLLVTQKNNSTVIQRIPKMGSARRRVRRRMVPFACSSRRRRVPGAPPGGQGRRGTSRLASSSKRNASPGIPMLGGGVLPLPLQREATAGDQAARGAGDSRHGWEGARGSSDGRPLQPESRGDRRDAAARRGCFCPRPPRGKLPGAAGKVESEALPGTPGGARGGGSAEGGRARQTD